MLIKDYQNKRHAYKHLKVIYILLSLDLMLARKFYVQTTVYCITYIGLNRARLF